MTLNEKTNSNISYKKQIRLTLRIMALILIVFIVLAIFFYPEPYHFEYYISYLGESLSVSLLDNSISRSLFRIGIILSNICTLYVGILYLSQKTKLNYIKGFSILFLGIAMLFLFFPLNGIYHKLHRIGSFLPIWMLLYNYLSQFIRENNNEITFNTNESKKITFDKWAVFFATIPPILYFIFWILDADYICAIMQKVVFILSIMIIFFIDLDDI